MAQFEASSGARDSDPSGSIFLKSDNMSDRDMENHELAIILRRGIAAGMSYQEQKELYEEYVIVRQQRLASAAISCVEYND